MLSVTIVSLKFLTGTFYNCLSYEKVLIMAKVKNWVIKKKAPIVKLWKDGESYRNISTNLDIPLTIPLSLKKKIKNSHVYEYLFHPSISLSLSIYIYIYIV